MSITPSEHTQLTARAHTLTQLRTPTVDPTKATGALFSSKKKGDDTDGDDAAKGDSTETEMQRIREQSRMQWRRLTLTHLERFAEARPDASYECW